MAVACALVALVTASCVPPEEELEPLDRDYGANTTMGAIQERGVLAAGVSDVTGLREFTEALARELARLLDVRLEVVPVESDNVHVLLRDGTIDIGFPLKPLTEEIVRRNAVTDPYLVASQRILGAPGSSAETLSGAPVCITGEEPVTVEIGDAIRGSIAECAEGLRSGDFEAVSGLEVELAAVYSVIGDAFEGGTDATGVDYRTIEITGDALSTAGLSAFVPLGATDMVAFVEQAFAEYEASGAWLAEFDSVYGSLLEVEPPDLSAEEAATLFPR